MTFESNRPHCGQSQRVRALLATALQLVTKRQLGITLPYMDALALAEIGDLDIAIQKLQLARRYSLGGSASNVPASSQLTLAVAEAVADALNLHETAGTLDADP